MFQYIIVPVDGSQPSWTAVRFGAAIAEEVDADIEVVTVVEHQDDLVEAHAALEDGLTALDDLPRKPSIGVLVGDSVAATLARHCESVSGSMIVMSSHGRGRSAAVLGSVADQLLADMFGPIIVIGPAAGEPRPLAGDILVPVDGSHFAKSSVDLAASWAIGLGGVPWIVEVLDRPTPNTGGDVIESSYPARLARELHQRTRHDVEFEVLHGSSPARSITSYAGGTDQRLIVIATHGRSGVERLRLGSTAAGVVRTAPCPVVLHRPPKARQ